MEKKTQNTNNTTNIDNTDNKVYMSEEQLMQMIDTMVQQENIEQVKQQWNKQNKDNDINNTIKKFLYSYYLQESIDYDKEKQQMEQIAQQCIEEEMKKKNNNIIHEELLDAIIHSAKLQQLENILAKYNEKYNMLREKLKNKKIEDLQTTMTFQMALGSIAMEIFQYLQQGIENKAKELQLDAQEVLQLTSIRMMGDIGIIIEIDGYHQLKIYKEKGEKEIDEQQFDKYIQKTIEYAKMMFQNKLLPQTKTVFSQIVGHFLYNEFEIENVQFMSKIRKELQNENVSQKKINLILEYVLNVEKARIENQKALEIQMQMMEQMFMMQPQPQQMQYQQQQMQQQQLPNFDMFSQNMQQQNMFSNMQQNMEQQQNIFQNAQQQDMQQQQFFQDMMMQQEQQGMQNIPPQIDMEQMQQMMQMMQNMDVEQMMNMFQQMNGNNNKKQ